MGKIRLLKFGATWCGPCRSMARAKVFEKFQEKHPDVEVVLYDLPGGPVAAVLEDDGELENEELLEDLQEDLPEGLKGLDATQLRAAKAFKDFVAPFAEADQEAEERDVNSLPTIIFEDEHGQELIRATEAMSLSALEKLYKEALAMERR